MRPVWQLKTRIAPSPQQAARCLPSGENRTLKISEVFSVIVIAFWRQYLEEEEDDVNCTGFAVCSRAGAFSLPGEDIEGVGAPDVIDAGSALAAAGDPKKLAIFLGFFKLRIVDLFKIRIYFSEFLDLSDPKRERKEPLLFIKNRQAKKNRPADLNLLSISNLSIALSSLF